MTKIIRTPVRQIMAQSYLDYAMSVIMERALPDVRDGLKPVHRRILYAMYEAGNTYSKPYRKAARSVGDVMGKYHPHGDKSIYDAAVRMAQPFSMSQMLLDGQGNFGSIDGDMPAAMRYTEIRLSRIAGEMFTDLGKETVNFHPNYDGQNEEPEVLPTSYPNLLVNGVDGIAVGMASSIPPHNLSGVIDATILMMDNPDCTVDDIVRVMEGPDFPTAGIVHSLEGFRQAVETGRGRIKLRAKWHEEDRGRGAKAIVIDEIPYQVNKAVLVAKIAELVREKEVEGIVDLRDESNKKGIRIWIVLRSGESPEAIFSQIAAKTDAEVSFSYNTVVLDGGRPMLMGLGKVIEKWIEFRQDVVLKRYIYERKQALARLHVLIAYMKALSDLDNVIRVIRNAESPAVAKAELIELLAVDEIQAQAVLDLRLQKLTGMEINSIKEEHEAVEAKVKELTEIIESNEKIRAIIKEELEEVKKRYGHARRTEIGHGLSDISLPDLIPREQVIVSMTKSGYIKRMPVNALRSQNRGTRGKTAVKVADEDLISFFQECHSHDNLLIFTKSGKAHRLPAYQIPEGNVTAKGRHIRNVIDGLEEDIHVVLALPESDPETSVLTVSKGALIKKTAIDAYQHANRKGGIQGVGLDEGDELINAFAVKDADELILISEQGRAVRFTCGSIRASGRTSKGVTGMRFKTDGHLVGSAIVPEGKSEEVQLMCVSENGIGKKSRMELFPPQARGGLGRIAVKTNDKTGKLVAALAVNDDQDAILLSSAGVSNRIAVSDINEKNRHSAGIILMKLDPGSTVVNVTTTASQPEDVNSESETVPA